MYTKPQDNIQLLRICLPQKNKRLIDFVIYH
jgi:hypothetical protein